MRLITLEDARQAAEAAVARKGEDYVYEKHDKSCIYVTYDKAYDELAEEYVISEGTQAPSCLVGHMLIDSWGVDPELFAPSGGTENIENNMPVDEVIHYTSSLEFTPEALNYMTLLQQQQDLGEAWGWVLSYAETYANSRQ